MRVLCRVNARFYNTHALLFHASKQQAESQSDPISQMRTTPEFSQSVCCRFVHTSVGERSHSFASLSTPVDFLHGRTHNAPAIDGMMVVPRLQHIYCTVQHFGGVGKSDLAAELLFGNSSKHAFLNYTNSFPPRTPHQHPQPRQKKAGYSSIPFGPASQL